MEAQDQDQLPLFRTLNTSTKNVEIGSFLLHCTNYKENQWKRDHSECTVTSCITGPSYIAMSFSFLRTLLTYSILLPWVSDTRDLLPSLPPSGIQLIADHSVQQH